MSFMVLLSDWSPAEARGLVLTLSAVLTLTALFLQEGTGFFRISAQSFRFFCSKLKFLQSPLSILNGVIWKQRIL